MSLIIGIDGGTHCGLARLTTNLKDVVGTAINFPKLRGMPRLDAIQKEITRTFTSILLNQGEAFEELGGVYIEEMIIHRPSSALAVVSVGTVIRKALYDLRIPWWEVNPATLKKWATGKGNAKKEQMSVAISARFCYCSPSDDIIDAVALAYMGAEVEAVGTSLREKYRIRPGW